MSPSTVRTARCALVWLSATRPSTWRRFPARRGPRSSRWTRHGAAALTDQSFDTLLVWLCSLRGSRVAVVWLWLTSTARDPLGRRWVGQSRPPHRDCADAPTSSVGPCSVACGVAVVGSMALPANAQPLRRDHGAGSNSAGTLHSQTLAGLPAARTRDSRSPRRGRSPLRVIPVVRSETDPAQVRVRAGDTLWAIAAHTLAPDAAPEAINDRCHELYELNRSVIGPDPDLIIPGQHLRLDTLREETTMTGTAIRTLRPAIAMASVQGALRSGT